MQREDKERKIKNKKIQTLLNAKKVPSDCFKIKNALLI